MTDIKSMTLDEISEALRAMGEPSFRGKQVFTWLHRGVTDFDQMINIPKSLREKLAQQGYDYLCSHFTRECMLEAMEKVFSTAAQRSRSR